MGLSESERLRKEAARDYRRIAELEAALDEYVQGMNIADGELDKLRRKLTKAEAALALSREQTEYANDAMMAMCKRAEKAEAALEHKCDDCLPKYGAYEERAERADAENTELRKQNEILSTTRRLEEEAREQAEADRDAHRNRRCEGCQRAHVDCSHAIVLINEDRVDIDFCSEWEKA